MGGRLLIIIGYLLIALTVVAALRTSPSGW
jgi:hypothetical protein